jgi:hypothetical protein
MSSGENEISENRRIARECIWKADHEAQAIERVIKALDAKDAEISKLKEMTRKAMSESVSAIANAANINNRLQAELSEIKSGEGHFCYNGQKWRSHELIFCSLCTENNTIKTLQHANAALREAIQNYLEAPGSTSYVGVEPEATKLLRKLREIIVHKPLTNTDIQNQAVSEKPE